MLRVHFYDTITVPQSKLVSIFVQSILYGECLFLIRARSNIHLPLGAYSVLFFITTDKLLRSRRDRRPMKDHMLFVSLLMFVVATMVSGKYFHS